MNKGAEKKQPRSYQPTYRLKLRTEDGALIEAFGDCSANKSWALHLVGVWFEHEPHGIPDPDLSKFLRAMRAFERASKAYRHRIDNANKAKQVKKGAR